MSDSMAIFKPVKSETSPNGDVALAPDVLSASEAEAYTKHKDTVSKAEGAFFPAGKALHEIKTRRLYRVDYADFVEFVNREWSMGNQYASRLINAYLTTVALVESKLPRPKNESIVRPLTSCKPALAKSVWQQLTVNGHQPTAEEVRSEIGKHIPRRVTKPRKSKTTKFRFGSAKVEVTPSKTMDVVTLLRKALAEAEEKAAPTRKAA